MTYWYFKFEGRFSDPTAHLACGGVFSGCLVPERVYRRARAIFLQSLREEGIELVETMEHFRVDGEELDPSDPLNEFWISWYERTKTAGKPVFDTYHIFPEGSD